MKKLVLILSFLSLCSCETLHYQSEADPAVEQARLKRIAEAKKQYARESSEPDEPEKPEQSPDECVSVWLKGRNDCQLVILDSLRERESILKNCKDSGKKKAECEQVFTEMVGARLAMAYKYGDFQKADLQCKADPIRCDLSRIPGKVEFEMLLRKTHDERARDISEAKAQEIRNQQAASDRARRQAIGAALSEFGRNMQRPQPPQSTTCNSVPNGVGGFRTECH